LGGTLKLEVECRLDEMRIVDPNFCARVRSIKRVILKPQGP
jgi:hypothetical protein